MASAGERQHVFVKDSVIRGHHVSKKHWTPQIREKLIVSQESGNRHDRRAVAVMKEDRTVVGHVPREFSRTFWHFISHGGSISCEVTGRRKKGNGLEVPCIYKFTVSSESLIKRLKGILEDNE